MRRTLIFNIDKKLQKAQNTTILGAHLLFQRKMIRFAKRSAHTRAYIYKV